MELFLKKLNEKLPCRDAQLAQLYNYIGEKDEPVPSSIYIYGNTATGKTSSIKAVLEYFEYRHVVLNAVECYSTKIMFETILDALAGHACNKEERYAPLLKCDNMKDFVQHLNNILPEDDYEPVFIVIDKAERLRNMERNILPAFLQLREFCESNICTVLVSNIVFEKYYPKTGLREPFKIFFPQYTKEELYKIIFASQRACVDFALCQTAADGGARQAIQRSDLFANYLNAFLSVFYRPCRDVVELRRMARANFVKYCRPVAEGRIQPEDVAGLWRHAAPALRGSLGRVYLRVQPPRTDPDPGEDDPSCRDRDIRQRMERLGIQEEAHGGDSAGALAQSLELPFYAKFLLIAAYLASYNPVKEDKRLFVKYHGKQKKRMQRVNAKAKLSDRMNEQLGPKFFTLDRLLAIFYSILEERASLTANLLSQVSALVTLRLLAGSDDHSRYRCIAPSPLVTFIAKSVGFNLRKYLYDYI